MRIFLPVSFAFSCVMDLDPIKDAGVIHVEHGIGNYEEIFEEITFSELIDNAVFNKSDKEKLLVLSEIKKSLADAMEQTEKLIHNASANIL
jgi:hypothetical protein